MIRYYLIKEVDGVVVRRTEVTHTEPRDAKGRYISADPRWQSMVEKVKKARAVRCPRCGYEFMVA